MIPRADRIIDTVARILDVVPSAVRAPRSKRQAYARRLVAYVLWLDSGSDSEIGAALGANAAAAAGWRSLVRREAVHNRTVQRDLARIATALCTWAATPAQRPPAGTVDDAPARPAGGVGQADQGG